MLRFSYGKKINLQQIMFYINLCIFVGCAAYLGNYYYQGYRSESKIDALRSKMNACSTSGVSYASDSDETGNKDDTDNSTTESKSARERLEAYAQARESEYPYLVGRIKIEGTPIDYFVMQTPDDPEYFLDKDVTGGYNKEGTPFIDVNCDLQLPSNNIMIYAHAMKNQHQFGSLRKYKSEEYYKEHPIIQFETMYEPMCDYEIVAAFYGTVYDEKDVNVFRYYYFFGCENERDFDYYIDNVRELACYDTGIIPKFGDQLITLSTCNNEKTDMEFGRFVVVARKITSDNSNDESQNKENVTDEPSSESTDSDASEDLSYDELINSLNVDETIPAEEATPTDKPTSKPDKKPVENSASSFEVIGEDDTEELDENGLSQDLWEIDVGD